MPTDPFPVVTKVIPASLGALWLLVDSGARPSGRSAAVGCVEGSGRGSCGNGVPGARGPVLGGRKARSSPRSLFPLELALSPPQFLRGSGMHPLWKKGGGPGATAISDFPPSGEDSLEETRSVGTGSEQRSTSL